MNDDKLLKFFFVLQSLSPLSLMEIFKHFDIAHFNLVKKFVENLCEGDWSVILKAVKSSFFLDISITIICFGWIIMTIIGILGFRNLQRSSMDSKGEKITVLNEKNDSGVSFFVTFVLPLFVDDSGIRGVLLFICLICIMVLLLMRSSLFYQNPVLSALNYKIYEFKFVNPNEDVEKDKTYIGITRKKVPAEARIIKRRHISDGVFYIINE